MSTEKEKTKNVKPEAAQPLTVETLYTREEIKATPSAFGVMPEVLAGALAMVEGDKLSRGQVIVAITAFENRKV